MIGFSKNPQVYLGIDLGQTGIKLVELNKVNEKLELSTYALAEFDENFLQHTIKGQSSAQEVARAVKYTCVKAKTRGLNVTSSVPACSVFTAILTVPNLSFTEMDIIIRKETKKLIHFSLEEVIVSWKIVGTNPNVQNILYSTVEHLERVEKPKDEALTQVTVVLTVVPKSIVTRYKEIFQLAGLKLVSLETETVALSRALVGTEQVSILILDIGAITSNIFVIENGEPVISRTIEVGGVTMTEALSKSLNLDFNYTEQLKYDVGLSVTSEDGKSTMSSVVEPIITKIIDEIKYSLNLYYKENENNKIEKIILTGGSALVPGIDQYISQLTSLSVYVGDPWFHVEYNKALQGLLYQIAPRMAVTVGLALKNVI